MTGKWFLQKDEKVEGPLSSDDVQARMQSGTLSSSHMIWGRGIEYWRPLSTWSADVTELTSVTQIISAPESWHYAIGGQSNGPMPRARLIEELKRVDNLGPVMLWTKGMKEWTPLFEFHDVLTEIGVNKRIFPRADLDGKAVFKGTGATLVAPLLSISEGGFGVQLESGIVSGQNFTVEIHSPAFREVLHAKAEVRYVGNGVIGMKFTNINVETKGLIIQFVRQSQVRFTLKAA